MIMECNGTLKRYKSRLVAQGYIQEYCMEYEETSGPAEI